MIAALFALAAAMTIAGVAAVVEGFPYVRLESGMAMVYGGAVVGSSGILLFGLAVVALGLKRVERSLRSGLAGEAMTSSERAEEYRDSFSDELHGMVPAAVPATPSTVDASLERPRIEPSLTVPPAPAPAAEPELPLPELVTPPAHRPTEPEPVRPGPEPAPVLTPAPAEDLFVPAPPPMPAPEPPPAPAAASDRVIVGRYSSGGNTYMMYSDGAIEADTPNGRFTFASLDELKAFVDSGGESGTRGAA